MVASRCASVAVTEIVAVTELSDTGIGGQARDRGGHLPATVSVTASVASEDVRPHSIRCLDGDRDRAKLCGVASATRGGGVAALRLGRPRRRLLLIPRGVLVVGWLVARDVTAPVTAPAVVAAAVVPADNQHRKTISQ